MSKIRNVVCIAIVLTLLPFHIASAGMFDWFNGYERIDESTESMSFDNIFNSLKNKKETPESDVTIERNSILSMASHIAPKVRVSSQSAKKSSAQYTVTATAYSSTPDQTDDSPFITASGTHVRDGIVATNFLPFGTVIKIPHIYGDKLFVVEDRMNRRYTDRVDIWFPEREAALQFGKRTIVVEVVSLPQS